MVGPIDTRIPSVKLIFLPRLIVLLLRLVVLLVYRRARKRLLEGVPPDGRKMSINRVVCAWLLACTPLAALGSVDRRRVPIA